MLMMLGQFVRHNLSQMFSTNYTVDSARKGGFKYLLYLIYFRANKYLATALLFAFLRIEVYSSNAKLKKMKPKLNMQ